MKWFDSEGNTPDIVLSTRIRLARNIADFPFPGRMSTAQEQQLFSDVSGFLSDSFHFRSLNISQLIADNPFKAGALVEQHLISPELATKKGTRGVILSDDDSISVMVNEEDHLRIQALGSGLCLNECMSAVDKLDDFLESRFRFAWNEQLGYLTHCPTNLGTGLRASVMLHLPAHTESGDIKTLIPNLAKLGFTVRGFFGEGSKAAGAIYQISNQLTLGISEQDAVERLNQITLGTISRERDLRRFIANRHPGLMEDRIWRAFGILSYARRISAEEAMNLLSAIRIGIASGELKNITYVSLNNLIRNIQPNSICADSAKTLIEPERDIARADIIRRTLNPA